MPAANPNCPFPPLIYKPLFQNIRALLRSRPLALAVVGIAFFTFLVHTFDPVMMTAGSTALQRHIGVTFNIVCAAIACRPEPNNPTPGETPATNIAHPQIPAAAVAVRPATIIPAPSGCYPRKLRHWHPRST